MALITLPDKFVFYFLIVCNGMIVSAGFASLMLGIYKSTTVDHHVVKKSSADGATSILAGLMELGIGTLGLVGAVYKKRILLIVYSAVLGTMIVGCIVLVIILEVSTSTTIAEARENIKKSIREHYGKDTDVESVKFTASINHHQSVERCCGWSGIDGENLFLDTTWHTEYKRLNWTLPESCCETMGSACRTTRDVKAARSEGHVHKVDCMDKMAKGVRNFVCFLSLQLILGILLQMAVCTVTVVHLVQTSQDSS